MLGVRLLLGVRRTPSRRPAAFSSSWAKISPKRPTRSVIKRKMTDLMLFNLELPFLFPRCLQTVNLGSGQNS
jgi:hypothetical protein